MTEKNHVNFKSRKLVLFIAENDELKKRNSNVKGIRIFQIIIGNYPVKFKATYPKVIKSDLPKKRKDCEFGTRQ